MPKRSGINVTNGGIYVMRKSTPKRTNNIGVIALMIILSDVSEIPETTKRSIPNGGVDRPIIILSVITTPKCTRSMPKASISGKTIGIKTRIIVIVSTNIPSMMNTMFISNSSRYLFVVTFRRNLATVSGICSIATM